MENVLKYVIMLTQRIWVYSDDILQVYYIIFVILLFSIFINLQIKQL